MRNLLPIFIIFISFIVCGSVHEPRFAHIGLENGLSHATINGIVQDARGYLWIGTPDGLNRYDGYKFDIFTPDSADHYIRTVAADSTGLIWAASARTLTSYDAANERFINHTFPEGINANVLLPVGGGNIVAGTSAGLYIFNSDSESFSRMESPSGINVTALALYNNKLYAGTDKGSVYEIGNDGEVRCLPLDVHDEINVFLVDRNRLLIGTEGFGLISYDANTDKGTRIDPDFQAPYVRSLAVDSQHRLWVGTFTGLYLLDAERKKIVFNDNATSPEGGLSHSSVRRIYIDNDGGIWLGTFFGGLNYYHPNQNQFTTIRKHAHDSSSIADNIAGPMAEDSHGHIWIGTNNGGLNIYDPAKKEFLTIKTGHGLGSDDVKAILIDETEGNAYIGTHIGGLTIVDADDARRIVKRYDKVQSVYDILNATHGKLWLATLDGIWLYDKPSNTAKKIINTPSRATDLLRDSKGRIWVGGEDGMAVYRENGEDLLMIPQLPHFDFHVNNIYQSHDKKYFWISTYRGLYRYDESTGETAHFDTSDGLPGDIVYATLEDPNGNVWATTNRGLACVKPSDGKIMSYTKRDGLHNTQFTDKSALRASNGLLYFGGTEGVTFFNPSILEKNLIAAAPFITGLRLFDTPVTPGDDSSLLKKSIAETERLTFNHRQSNFTIDFTVCDFLSHGENTFQYMLDGLDRQWLTLPAGVRSVTYTNLPDGDYRFRLRAANNDGIFSQKEASIEIRILPPWWATWWAIALWCLIAIIGGLLVIRYIWRRKSREKLQKAREEVNEMKVRFFVNMSHELRTPLTLMLLPVNDLLSTKSDPVTLQKLNIIRNNTLRISHIVNQLLDYRRAELGMFRLAVAEIDINSLMNSIMESYQSLADKRHISLRLNSTLENPMVMADINYIELIANNLLTNAFKYTPDGGAVTVDLSSEDDLLKISVKDSGCGIPADKLGEIFTRFYQVNDSAGGYGIGLSLVKRLVELHHGSISVESEPGVGSRFEVRLPMSRRTYQPAEISESAPQADIRPKENDVILPVDEELTEQTPANADGRKTILLVDDNADILKYLSAAMSSAFHVLTAANGNKAIDLLGSESIDLVVSDVMMPDMDGVQLCRAIKRNLRTSHIPVILLSAKADVADRLEGLHVGADDYIAKPFNMDELLAKVRNQIRTRDSIIMHYSQNTATIEPSKVAQNPLDEEFLNKAVKVMNEHLDDSQFTTDEFARHMCMSRSNLHLKMKALTGESTNDFVRRVRMQKAVELLKTRRYTVAEVSAMVGYNTPAYFATAFKAFYGRTPSSLLAND